MSIGALLFALIAATALVFHKKLSAQPHVPQGDPFPDCTTPEQQYRYVRMEHLYDSGDYADSIKAANELMRSFLHSPWLYRRRGICLAHLGRYEDGIADLTSDLDLEGSSDDGKVYSLGPGRTSVISDIQQLRARSWRATAPSP